MRTWTTEPTETGSAAGTRPAAAAADASAEVAAVRVRELTVHYGEVPALLGVNFQVEAARVCGLLGVNGSGKSTLFRALMGTVRPTRGEVRLLGGDPPSILRACRVGYVPQAEAVDWEFPVRVHDVVLMGRYGRMGARRVPRPADRAAVGAALDRVGLTELAGRQIGALSGGQRKRAFLARAIAQDAELLLLDEPFAGVDKGTQESIRTLLHELRDEGRTVVVSTHDLAGVAELCDEVVLLHQRVLAHGTPREVLTPEVLAGTFALRGGLPGAA